jgi:SnoaL-like domain
VTDQECPPPGSAAAPAGVEARLDRLASMEEIRTLACRYALATDARDIDALVGLFVEDVRVGGGRRGRAALREVFFDARLRRIGVSILHVGNHVIDFAGPDDATGVVYCRAEIQTSPDTWISQAIHYGDTYARRDGRWYFVRRQHLLWYGVELGRRPIGQPAADWPANSTGTGTLPAAWPTWREFWRTAEDPPQHRGADPGRTEEE